MERTTTPFRLPTTKTRMLCRTCFALPSIRRVSSCARGGPMRQLGGFAAGWAAAAGGRGGRSHASCSSCSGTSGDTAPLQGGAKGGEDDWLQRSRLLVGADGLAALASTNVLLVGLGGVGSFAAEFLVRAGLGRLTIVDGDSVDTTNRNRQLPALASTVGLPKAAVVAARLVDINPALQLTVKQEFLGPGDAAALVDCQPFNYVVDAIDSVAPKQALLLAGVAAGCHVVSSMGAGGRLDPSRVQLADISQTYNDAFAAVVRRGLRKKGVSSGITVVFSDELARPASLALTQQQYKKSYFGTCSYIPALFGLHIASHIIRHAADPGYKQPAPARRQPQPGGRGKRPQPAGGKQQQLQQQQPKQRGPANQGGDDEAAGVAAPAAAAETSSSSSCSGGSSGSSSTAASRGLLASFDDAQGSGMGYDGGGI